MSHDSARDRPDDPADGAYDETQTTATDALFAHAESRYRALRSAGRELAGPTVAQLLALPVTFAFDPVVPAAFGISRSAAYRALAAGELPIRPLRLGRKLIVKRADLLAALGIEERPAGKAASAPDP
jgi:hypothetical protein